MYYGQVIFERNKPMLDNDTPQDGWWPEDNIATVTQMFFKNGNQIANVIKQTNGWRAFSCIETDDTNTTGRPLGDIVITREEAKTQCETYAQYKEQMTIPAAMFIEAAAGQLTLDAYHLANTKDLNKQMKEIQEAMPNQSKDFYFGYMLGIQTARVFMHGNMAAIQAKIIF